VLRGLVDRRVATPGEPLSLDDSTMASFTVGARTMAKELYNIDDEDFQVRARITRMEPFQIRGFNPADPIEKDAALEVAVSITMGDLTKVVIASRPLKVVRTTIPVLSESTLFVNNQAAITFAEGTSNRLPPLIATYPVLYTRPVQLLYERLFGRGIAVHEWQRIDDVYHAAYGAALHRAWLNEDAEAALEAVARAGWTQSLLSMYRHDELVPLVSAHGIDERFVRIDGLRGPGGGPKAPHLEEHLAALDGAGRSGEVVVIGDALDDAAAAAHVGAPCILYDGGSHPPNELRTAGVPVASTLIDALRMATVS